jgi:hypothetical protein
VRGRDDRVEQQLLLRLQFLVGLEAGAEGGDVEDGDRVVVDLCRNRGDDSGGPSKLVALSEHPQNVERHREQPQDAERGVEELEVLGIVPSVSLLAQPASSSRAQDDDGRHQRRRAAMRAES